MILSVYMPHGEPEMVKKIIEEVKKMGSKDFSNNDDFNIEPKVESGNVEFLGVDSLDWYVLFGPGCQGGGEDVVTYDTSCTVQNF